MLIYLKSGFLNNDMKLASVSRENRPAYLDITQFLFREQSPHLLPQLPPLEQRNQPCALTPEINPEIVAPNLTITPLILSKTSNPIALLEENELEQFCLEGNRRYQRSRTKIQQPFRHSLYWLQNHADNDIEKIIQRAEQDLEQEGIHIHSQPQQQSDQNSEEFDSIFSDNLPLMDEQGQSAAQFELKEHSFNWGLPDVKNSMISKLKSVLENRDIANDEDRKDLLKIEVRSYSLQSERYYIDDCLNNLQGSIQQIFDILCKGIGQTLERKIGGLSFEKRRVKILNYIKKKKRRTWNKKVNYNCRKKVADGRLRIKGKFVTHTQAREQLALSNSTQTSYE